MEELLPITDTTAQRYGEPSAKAAYQRIARGQWPCVRIGRRVYLDPRRMARLIAARTVEPFEAPSPDGRRRGAA